MNMNGLFEGVNPTKAAWLKNYEWKIVSHDGTKLTLSGVEIPSHEYSGCAYANIEFDTVEKDFHIISHVIEE
jgi:hypothetical protein